MKRNAPEASGVILTKRGIYNYFEDCNIAKTHKLADVIMGHCLTVEFMGDLEEMVCGTAHWESPNLIRRAEELF